MESVRQNQDGRRRLVGWGMLIKCTNNMVKKRRGDLPGLKRNIPNAAGFFLYKNGLALLYWINH